MFQQRRIQVEEAHLGYSVPGNDQQGMGNRRRTDPESRQVADETGVARPAGCTIMMMPRAFCRGDT